MSDAAAVHTPAADTNAWPLLPGERNWGVWKLAIALVTVAAATWCYLIGEYTAYYLDFRQAFATLTAGSMVGILAVAAAAVPTCIRFGVDSIASAVPQFGTRGKVIPSLLQFISIIGWNCLLLIFFAKSAGQLLVAIGVIDVVTIKVIVPATVLFACALVFLFLLGGSTGVDRVAKILVAHVFLGGWMLYILISRRWDELAHARPVFASPDPLWNYTTGFEIGIASILGWWPYIGSMVRMAPNGRTATVPVMLGMGASVPALCLVGIAGYLVFKTSDPAEWLRVVGGPAYGIIALVFVTAANLGTAAAGTYACAIGLRYYPGFDRAPWPLLVIVALAPVAVIGLSIPELFFTSFKTFIAFIGIAFAPLCGIQIVDYYILRRRRIAIRAIYDGGAAGDYHYWHGVNPAAVLAMAAGIAVYIALLNPITYASAWVYRYTTASLPAMGVAAATFWIVTRIWVIPARQGGYRMQPKGLSDHVR